MAVSSILSDHRRTKLRPLDSYKPCISSSAYREEIMSRSFRREPVVPCTGKSEKNDKKFFHRRMRHEEKRRLKFILTKDLEDHITTLPHEVSDPNFWTKDGKARIDPEWDEGKWMRK